MTAPNSVQAHKLNAEALEAQGKWDAAEKEYKTSASRTRSYRGRISCWAGCCSRSLIPAPTVPKRRKRNCSRKSRLILRMRARSMCWANWRDRTSHGPKPSRIFRARPNWMPASGTPSGAGHVPDFRQAVSGGGLAAGDCGQAGAEESGRPLQFGHGFESGVGRKQDADREFAIHRQMTEKRAPAQRQRASNSDSAARSELNVKRFAMRSSYFSRQAVYQTHSQKAKTISPHSDVSRRHLLRGLAGAVALSGLARMARALPDPVYPFEDVPPSVSGITWTHTAGKSPRDTCPKPPARAARFSTTTTTAGWTSTWSTAASAISSLPIRPCATRSTATIATALSPM